MASSTTMPMASTKANREMVLIATSSTSMTARVPMPAMARPAHTHKASRICMNRASAMNTSSSPRRPFFTSRSARSS